MTTTSHLTIDDVLGPTDNVLVGVTSNVTGIIGKLEWLDRVVKDQRGRLLIATQASTRFGAAVAAFLEDPDGVGRNELRDEYDRFMAVHAGNFYSMQAE